MAILQLPKKLHPEFAKRNRQPLCPVEIDWTNPLTKGLVGFYMMGTRVNLVTGEQFNPFPDLDPKNNAVGKGIEFGSNDRHQSGNTLDFNNNEASVYIHGLNLENSGTTFTRLVSYADSGSASNQGWALVYNSTSDNLYWSSRTSSTYYDDTTRINMTQASGEKILSVRVDNASSTKTVDYNLNNQFKTQGTSASANWLNITATDQFVIGDSNDTNTGELNTVIMFNRRLTDAEDKALHEDLYQLLKPSTPQFYFVTGEVGPGPSVTPIPPRLANLDSQFATILAHKLGGHLQ